MSGKITSETFKFNYVLNGDSAQKELHDLERSTKELNSTVKEARLEKKKLENQGEKSSAEYKEATRVIRENSAKLRENESRMEQLRREIGMTSLTMRQLRSESRKLKITMDNMTPGTAEYRELELRLRAVDARMRELRGSARATGSSLSRLADGFNKYSAMGIGLIATLTGVVFQLQQIIDFNGKMSESMSDVRKTTGMTQEEVEELSKSFGILESRTSRINLLKIAEQGGRLGLPKEDIAEFVGIMDKATVALGDDFPGGVEEAAHGLGILKGLFRETREMGIEEGYNSIGSAINELAANGLASAPNLANFTARVGAMPEALRPAIAEALGLGAAFEESGLQAEQSARAYSIFQTTASKDVEKFAYVMGISTEEVKKMINTDPTGFFLEFSQGLQGMDATDTANTLDYLSLNADGVKKILGAAASNTQLFRDKMVLANESMEDGTSLLAEYEIKNNNFQATLDKIGKKMRGAFISDGFVEFLNTMVNGFAMFIGATETSNSSVLMLRKSFLFLLKMILVAATGFISYTAAVKLATLWTNRQALSTTLLNIAEKAAIVTKSILRGAIYFVQIAYFRLTGQIAKARGAMVLFNMTTGLSPLGALAALLAVATAAYFVFRDSAKAARTQQDLINDAVKEANVETAGQIAKIKALDKVVQDSNKSDKARIEAIKELNKIVPEYNKDIDLSKEALDRATLAVDQYVDALKRKAQAQALSKMLEDKAEELEKAKMAALGEDLNYMQKVWHVGVAVQSSENAKLEAARLKKQKEDTVAALEEEMDVITKSYVKLTTDQSNADTPLETQLKNLRAMRDDFKKGTEEYIFYQKQIDALTRKFKIPEADDKGGGSKTKETDYLKELQAQRFQAAEERVSLIKDASQRERALEEISHARKVHDLRESLIKTDKLKGDALKNALDHNKEVNDRIELEDKTHQLRLGTIAANGMRDDLEQTRQHHEDALREMKIIHDRELTGFEGTQEQKKRLVKQHQLEELHLQEQHANELKAQLENLFSEVAFEGIDIELLSDENRQKFNEQIDELRAKLAELSLAKSNLTSPDDDPQGGFEKGSFGSGEADGVDILGFSIGDYETMWANLETTQGQIMAVGMAIGALGNMYSMYSDMLTRQEDRDMEKFTANQERKKESLDRRFDRGVCQASVSTIRLWRSWKQKPRKNRPNRNTSAQRERRS